MGALSLGPGPNPPGWRISRRATSKHASRHGARRRVPASVAWPAVQYKAALSRACSIARWGLLLLMACAPLAGAAPPTQPDELQRLLQEGSALSDTGDYGRAVAVLSRAVQLAPRDPRANYLLGVALLESGHPTDAIPPLRLAADADEGNPAAEGYLGDAEMEVKHFGLAAEMFERAVARSPGSEQALVWWTNFSLERYRQLMFALCASTNGRAAFLQVAAESSDMDRKQVQSLLSQAATMNPHLDEIWGETGVAQARLGMDAEAVANLKRARQAQPEALSTLELESMVDAARGDWPDADALIVDLSQRSRTEWERFLAAWPRKLVPDANDSSGAARCLREGTAACEPAIEHQRVTEVLSSDRLFAQGRWELLIALAPPAKNDALNWFRRGIGFAKLGRCSEAIPALESGLEAGAENAAARLATCYESEAERAADRLKAEGKESAVHKIRGDILLSIRLDPSQAVNEYNQALELKPNDPEILEKLAEAYFSLGEMDRARQSAESALRERPHRTQVLRLLVRIAIGERDYSTALGLLDKLAALEPDDPWVRIQQGTAYAQTGRPKEAAERLKPALEAGYADEKGALHAILSSQLRKLGRDEEAKRVSDEAVRLADSYQQQTRSQTKDWQ